MKEVEFLEFMIHNLVTKPQEVEIQRVEDELGILLTLSVAKDDMWIIIGKGGNTINSIRSILRIYGLKINQRVNLKVLD